jgi:peptidoglycan/LPS O-acetylase OafA/YrhL
LFLLLSGFALVWSCLDRGGAAQKPMDFYRRRLIRIYPQWIVANVLLLDVPAVFGIHGSLADSSLYASLLGIRVLRRQMYYGWSAWWFIGLILQLYFLFPFLYRWLLRLGPSGFALVTVTSSLVIRGAGLFYFTGYLDCWSRGAIFITRLPEFAVGMALAVWMRRNGGAGLASLRSVVVWVVVGLCLLAAGTAASFTLAGMSVAPLLQSVGLLLVFFRFPT